MVTSCSTRLITDAGMSTMWNYLRVMRFPIVRQRNVYLTWKLVVVSMQIVLCVRCFFILFNGQFYSCNSWYAPNSALQCFCLSSVVPVMIERGINIADTVLLTGKEMRHMTKNFSSFMIIHLGLRLNGRLMRIDRALSVITRICISISGICLLASVGLIYITGK